VLAPGDERTGLQPDCASASSDGATSTPFGNLTNL